MIRYWYINVDMASGYDVPERVFPFLKDAVNHYNSITLSRTGIVYKALCAFDDEKGSVLIERVEV